jgi:hypothetical protein
VLSCCQLPSTKEAAVTRILGLVLIALGGFAVFLGGFTYTTQERIVDIGVNPFFETA